MTFAAPVVFPKAPRWVHLCMFGLGGLVTVASAVGVAALAVAPAPAPQPAPAPAPVVRRIAPARHRHHASPAISVPSNALDPAIIYSHCGTLEALGETDSRCPADWRTRR